MNPLKWQPKTRRQVIYAFNALGSPVVAYALARGWISDLELGLWAAEMAAGFTLAGVKAADPVE